MRGPTGGSAGAGLLIADIKDALAGIKGDAHHEHLARLFRTFHVKNARTTTRKSSGRGLDMPSFCAWDGETLVLNVLGTPGANRDAIGKPQGQQLRISVTEAPVAGRATDHMVRFLAKEFGVSAADITVVFGRFNVNKQLRIRAPGRLPAVVAKALAGAQSA